MDSVNFAYWLQGLFELQDIKSLNSKQVETIKRHANLVLKTIEIKLANKPQQYVAKPGIPPRIIDRKITC